MKFFKKLWDDKFRRYMILVLIIIGLFLLFPNGADEEYGSGDLEVNFFYHPQCPHCNEQKPFNQELIDKYPEIKFVYHDVSKNVHTGHYMDFAEEHDIPAEKLAVPGTFFGNYHFIGFDTKETTGVEIEEALQKFIAGEDASEAKDIIETKLNLPIIGEVDAMDYSLPVLAILLGLVDGFNPCAMWVLVYLISLIMSIKDRRKIWLLVGSFVLASGILYYLFMTLWLNVFLIIGYLRPLTIIVGLAALGIGIDNLKTYITTKGALECEIGDVNSKKKTMSRMERIVHSPLTLATVFGIIGLAFVVNSIEFACSSAIPLIFTQVLALSNLSTLQHYLYILLYDLFFMLDDLIIFGLAAFAVNTTIGDKYAKYCKLIGGLILILLGVFLVFFPGILA